MDETAKSRVWPARFPIGRALFAFLLIPLFTPLAYQLFDEALWWRHPILRETPKLADLSGWLGFTLAFSWPGYLMFLLFGLPTLYLLYGLRWSRVSVFALIGALYTFLPWIWITLHSGGHNTNAGAPTGRVLLAELEIFGSIGVVNGILTWLIVIWRRSPQSQPDRVSRHDPPRATMRA